MPSEPRRVRTQVERDADDHAWRRDLIGVRTADGRLHAPEDVHLVYPADRPDPDIWMTTESIRPPRRRWWHRLTRALAGRWLHVLTPGFLGELSNDIWSHTRHRLTRRNP